MLFKTETEYKIYFGVNHLTEGELRAALKMGYNKSKTPSGNDLLYDWTSVNHAKWIYTTLELSNTNTADYFFELKKIHEHFAKITGIALWRIKIYSSIG